MMKNKMKANLLLNPVIQSVLGILLGISILVIFSVMGLPGIIWLIRFLVISGCLIAIFSPLLRWFGLGVTLSFPIIFFLSFGGLL